MSNLALETTGAKVVFASSWDPSHPPEAVIDGSENTFWSTTGMYPQELIITFDSNVTVASVSTKSFNCKKVTLLKSVAKQPSNFIPLSEGEIPDGEGQIQEHKHDHGETVMRHLKIIIESGYSDFSALMAVVAGGENADIGVFNN